MKINRDDSDYDLSIVTIAYNVNHDLDRCISSCKFSKISVQHIIVLPKRETKRALSKFNDNFKIIFDEGKGVYKAINLGLSYANGKKILILHGDNFLTRDGPELIEKNIHHGNIQFGCNYILKEKYKKFLFSRINFLNLLAGLYPPHPGLVMKKIDYYKLNYYNEKYLICSDFDFYLKIYKSKIKIKYITKEIINAPLGGLSSSGFISVIFIISERFRILSKKYWFVIPFLPITILIGYVIKLIYRKFNLKKRLK